jgi:hypothetical protein
MTKQQQQLDAILNDKANGVISVNEMAKAIEQAGMNPITYRRYLGIHYVKARCKDTIIESTITNNEWNEQ